MFLCVILTAACQPLFSLLTGLRLFKCTFTFVIHALLLAGIHRTVWCYQRLSPLQPLRTSHQLRDMLSLSRLEGRAFLSDLENLYKSPSLEQIFNDCEAPVFLRITYKVIQLSRFGYYYWLCSVFRFYLCNDNLGTCQVILRVRIG